MRVNNHKINPFLNVLGALLKTVSVVIGTLFVATVVEWCGMHSWWQNGSESRLHQRTQIEFQKIESSIRTNFDRHWFRRTVSYLSTLSDRFLVPIERYLEVQQRELEHSPESISAVVGVVVQIQHSINRHLWVATEVFRAWLFRLSLLMFGIVSVAPLLVVGLIDGLVRREVRRWGGGRESAWLFVFARKLLSPLMLVFLAVYTLWPWSFSFVWINCLMGLCWGCALSLAVAQFKKYL